MLVYNVKSSFKLESLILDYDQYQDGGHVSIIVNDRKSQMGYVGAIIALLSQKGILCERPYSKWISFSIVDFRKAIDELYHNDFISIEDRADLEEEIRKAETVLSNRSKLKPIMNDAQSEILMTYMCDVYIEELLDISKNIYDFFSFINAVICSPAATLIFSSTRESPNEEWEDFLIKKQKILLTEEEKNRLFDCLTGLGKCYHGKANLESALIQNGVGLPVLNIQQEIIFSSIRKAFFEKFSDLDITMRFLSLLSFNVIQSNYPIANSYKERPKNINYILDVLDTLMTPKEDYKNIPKHLRKIRLSDFLSHDIFIKLIASTLKDANLSLNDLAASTRFKIAKMCKESWEFLDKKSLISEKLTKEERDFCQDVLTFFDGVFREKINAKATCDMQERFDTFQSKDREIRGKLFIELQDHQSKIQQGDFLGKYGFLSRSKMRVKCAAAAENRLNDFSKN